MRNLKKVLSMVLCVAMMLSVMVMGTGAAFADQNKIENTEAVDMCVALKIIDGKENNMFDPAGNVTRAEMCKMICVALNGGKAPATATNPTPTYSDIKGHWAEGYIEYCSTDGIISGMGNGIFAPDASVTATQAAKMLLTALGYNATVEKFVGPSWSLYVNVKANQDGLYKDLSDIKTDLAMSRDNAAQMIWNALNAKVVVKTSSIKDDGTITYNYNKGNDDMLNVKFGATTTDAAVLKSVTLDSKGTYTLTTDATSKNSFTKVVGDYTELLGQKVRVVFKDTDDVYGVFATADNTTVSGYVSDIESISTTEVKVDGTKYKLDGEYTITDNVFANSFNLTKNATSMNEFTLIDNDADEKYEGVVITTVNAAKVTYASSTEIIAGGVTYKHEDHNIASGIAKDDYVSIVYNIASDKKDIAELEAVEGTVDAAKTINGESCVRVDGNWFIKNSQTLNVDTAYEFYAINGVVIPGSVTTSGANINNLIMVLGVDTSLKAGRALVMDATGATKTVDIDNDGVSPVAGALYTFTETDNGYKLKVAVTTGDYTWAAGADNGVTATSGKLEKIGGKVVADDAVIFVETTDGGKVITGKQFKNILTSKLDATDASGDAKANVVVNQIWDNDSGSFSKVSSGLDRVVYAGLYFNGKAKDLLVSDGNENYAFVTEASYEVGNNYTAYSVWTGTENLTVTDKGAASVVKGDIVTYDAIADGYISGVSKITVNNDNTFTADLGEIAAIQGLEGKYIYLDGVLAANKFEKNGDTKFLYVDSNADNAADVGKTEGSYDVAVKNGGLFRDNVIAIVNSSNEIVLLVVDVKETMTTATNATSDVVMTGLTGTYAQATASKTEDLQEGETFTITLKHTAGDVGAKTITLTNAVNTAGTNTISVSALTAGNSVTYTVVADGAGDISFTLS